MRSGGSTFGSFESEAGNGGWSDDAASGTFDAGSVSGEENSSEQRDRGEWSEEGGEESAGDGGAAAGVDALSGSSENAACSGALSVGVFEGVDDVFDDPVFGSNGDRAES